MIKTICMLLLFSGSIATAAAQQKEHKTPDPNKKVLIVEAACGECQFSMAGADCDLAVRIDGVSYFVDGTHIDSYGDAHAKDGFCNAVRKARVQGEVVDGRFKATYFQLLPAESAEKKKTN